MLSHLLNPTWLTLISRGPKMGITSTRIVQGPGNTHSAKRCAVPCFAGKPGKYEQSSFLVITFTLFGMTLGHHHLFAVMPQYGALINNLVVMTDRFIMTPNHKHLPRDALKDTVKEMTIHRLTIVTQSQLVVESLSMSATGSFTGSPFQHHQFVVAWAVISAELPRPMVCDNKPYIMGLTGFMVNPAKDSELPCVAIACGIAVNFTSMRPMLPTQRLNAFYMSSLQYHSRIPLRVRCHSETHILIFFLLRYVIV